MRLSAFDIFMRAIGGDAYQDVVDAALGADGRQMRDAGFFFTNELPAVRNWTLPAGDAARITQPTLIIAGELSPPRFHQACAIATDLLPGASTTVLPAVSHLMPLQDPAGLAAVIAGFADRH